MIAFADPPTASAPAQSTGRSIEELTRSVSASRLNTWLQCRLKFAFRYVHGIRKPPSSALHVGSVVHAVLQQWSLARWRRAPLDAGMVKTVFAKAWSEKQTSEPVRWDEDDKEETVKTAALKLVEFYLSETPIPVDERPEAVEVGAEADLSAHGLPKLIGVLDLVRAGGCIVDFKTTGRTPDAGMVRHTTEIQTTAYALLYREATGRNESGIELHHLVKTKTPKLVVTEIGPAGENQIARLFRATESYVAGLEREDFVPSPGLQCSSCEFINECRRWH